MQPSGMDSDSESDARTLCGKEAKFPSWTTGVQVIKGDGSSNSDVDLG
jgi:hypothetical protein